AAKRPARASLRYAKAPLSPRYQRELHQLLGHCSVLASTGQLTARDLHLPVQLYDAAAYYNLVKDGPAKYSKQGQALNRVLRALQKE
ncbi:MAG: hypothetical protein ABJD57_15355, partial [Roseibium sp.]|uniref:hypothetical protein n=1 Tax=Roseibium sp. TaxID=1936156 RepID=UPI003263CB1D